MEERERGALHHQYHRGMWRTAIKQSFTGWLTWLKYRSVGAQAAAAQAMPAHNIDEVQEIYGLERGKIW